MIKNYLLLFKIAVLFFSLFAVQVKGQNSCAGIPSANSVIVPGSPICNGTTAGLSLATNYAITGLTYQWQSSASSFGPFNAIQGATLNTYVTPQLYSNTYYNVVITCTNSNMTYITPLGLVLVSPSYSTVPCIEFFNGLLNNQLPGCWSATHLGAGCLTSSVSSPSSPVFCGVFHLNNTSPDYFYTNAIYLKTGITYSVGVWYKTDNTGATNWSNLSILLGTNQSSVGMAPIASTNGPIASPVFIHLTNIFTVAADGIYFCAIRGTSNNGLAENLYIDDFSITIPCAGLGAVNTPTLTMLSSNGTNTLCSANQYTLSASGANTYSWSTGANSASMTVSPVVNSFLTVVGTNTLTSCTSTLSNYFVVNPSPVIYCTLSQPAICPGQTIQVGVLVIGTTNYTWSTGATTTSIIVNPLLTTAYSVSTTNTFGCVGSANVLVTVSSPTIIALSTPSALCEGHSAVLTGSGAVTYQWSGFPAGNSVNISPTVSTIYSVTGTDSYSCSNSATLMLNVNPLPIVSLISTSTLMCMGETVTLTSSGAIIYQWTGPSLTSSVNVATVTPNISATYMVTGTDINGCANSANIYLQVDKCTGLDEINKNLNACKIYPNPGNGIYIIESTHSEIKNIVITDLAGKIIFSGSSANERISIDLTHFSNGIYYGKISLENQTRNFKIIKQ